VSRVRRHQGTPPSEPPAPPARTVETFGSLARKQHQREADLALLRAVVDHLDEYKPEPGDEDRWATEEEAFGGMLKRLDEGDAAILTKSQRSWALDVAERREVEWETPKVTAVEAPPRYVTHTRFGRGLVLDDREGKLDVDFGGDVGRKTLLRSFVTEAA
jgi:hypothetical protein